MKNYSMMGAALMLASLAYGQKKDSVQTAVLNDVTITANKLEQKQSTTGKVVSIISKQEIEKNAGRSLGQLLNEQAGISINGALSNLGSNQSVYMRGAATGRTLILIDGIPTYDPSLINSEFDLNLISLNDVERIEICRGAQSTLYGSDAIAGVINIITAKPDSNKAINIKATATAGSFSTYKGNLQVYGKQKGLSYSARYSKLLSNGFSAAHDSTGKGNFEKDGYNGDVVSSSLKYDFNNKFSAKTFIQYSRYKSDIDAGRFTDEKDFFINNKSLMTGAGIVYKDKRFSVTGNYQYSDINRNYLNDSIDRSGFNIFEKNDYFGKNQFVEIFANYVLGKGFSLLGGADYRYSSMNNQYFSISGFGNYESEFKDTSVKQASVYASLLFSGLKDKLHIEAGGRMNAHSRYGSNYTYTFNPSFSFSDQFRIFGSIASGFKAPSLYQLYASYSGNTGLEAEKSTNYEIGIQHQQHMISNRLVYFYRAINNGIDYNYNTFKYFNFIKQNVSGLEWELKLKLVEKLTVTTNYTYLSSTEKTQSRENFKDTSYTYLLRRPKHSVNMNLGFQATPKLFISASGKYAGNRYDVGNYQSPDILLHSYFIINAYAEFIINKHLKIFADAQNLGNKKFSEVNGYNAIPFIISGGLTLTL